MSATPSPAQNEPKKVFRQRTALVSGGFLLLVLAIVIVLTLLGDTEKTKSVMWCVAIGLLVWVALLRPSVVMWRCCGPRS
ncbi:hypothetical protein [Luteipulveratus mongoliensis]|uniref:Uncharacterized protein n=1 Tax=Luteipulveratus mongoliensis TaxID=571913 RepID=A0A0K1JHS4_9MICO|nr:hypothetical protein [Luteipulveratus mongoliensis]AKU16145.1 hypothetical protein VV02_10180 [Luteipulveratus mongoliensis]